MGTFRFVGTALAMLVAVFFGVRWLLPAPSPKPGPQPPTSRVDVKDPQFQPEVASLASDDDDAVRDALRQGVLDAAVALKDAPCDDVAKARYIEAAAKYARSWLSIAPCVGSSTCRQSDSARVELAKKAFGSPLDRSAREAMRRAHATGAIAKGDFPDDVARLVAVLAHDGTINPDASPEFKAVAEALWNGPLVCPALAR
jgi:hypothetical protein